MSVSARERAETDDRRTPWAWLIALTSLAVVLRAIGLNGGLWFDEIMTLIHSVRLPLSAIVTEFPHNNQHTLFSVLANLSVAAFGESAWSLRLPALVFGAAAVPALYVLARQFSGRTEALLACLLMTVAYHPVWFSQNARAYSALAFLTVTASWLLLRTLRTGRTRDAMWYGVAAALGVYAHLTMVFLVVSHALLCAAALVWPTLYPAMRQRWRPAALAFVLAAVFTFLLYSPVLLDLKQFFVDEAKPAAVATPKWAVLEMIRGLQIGLGAGLGAAAAAVLFLAGIWSYVRQSAFVAGLFLLPGAVTVAAAVALGRPIFPRFLFFLIGFGLLILVRGVLEVARWIAPSRAPAAGIVLVSALALVSVPALVTNYRYPKQDFEGAMRMVDAERATGEPVVAPGTAGEVYRDYYQRDWPVLTSVDELQRLRAGGRRVWVVYTLESYIADKTPDLMQRLRAECHVEAVFRGTVGHGDVTVCTTPPA